MPLSLNKPKLDNLAAEIWKSVERLRGKFTALTEGNLEVMSVAWTHSHFVNDDEYIPLGEDKR